MSTASLFDDRAAEYDSWYRRHRLTAENEVMLVRYMLQGLPGPCLEVGVGSGFFASAVGCGYGVDPSIEMLRIARSRGLEVALARGEKLPIRSSSVGVVLIVVSICFMDDPVEALREAYRVLMPGGRLVTCIVPAESPLGRYYMRLGRSGHPYYSRARFIESSWLARVATGIGFKLETVKATITYMPWEGERREDVRNYTGKEGFMCMRMVRG